METEVVELSGYRFTQYRDGVVVTDRAGVVVDASRATPKPRDLMAWAREWACARHPLGVEAVRRERLGRRAAWKRAWRAKRATDPRKVATDPRKECGDN